MGTWINGKTLYESVSYMSITAGTKDEAIFFDTPITDEIDVQFIVDAFLISSEFCYSIPTYNINATQYDASITAYNFHNANNQGRIWYKQGKDVPLSTLYIIYRYTKTE